MARDFVTEPSPSAEPLRVSSADAASVSSRGPAAARAACEAWRAEKPRHFMNEVAQQKWARVASAVIAAHEAEKEPRR